MCGRLEPERATCQVSLKKLDKPCPITTLGGVFQMLLSKQAFHVMNTYDWSEAAAQFTSFESAVAAATVTVANSTNVTSAVPTATTLGSLNTTTTTAVVGTQYVAPAGECRDFDVPGIFELVTVCFRPGVLSRMHCIIASERESASGQNYLLFCLALGGIGGRGRLFLDLDNWVNKCCHDVIALHSYGRIPTRESWIDS